MPRHGIALGMGFPQGKAAPLFTKANAGEFARRAAASRVAKLRKAQSAERELAKLKAEIAAAPKEAPPETREEQFRLMRLNKARIHLSRCDDLIGKAFEAGDAGELDKLASAMTKFAELERVTAGRALPGSLRPKPAQTSRTDNQSVEPVS